MFVMFPPDVFNDRGLETLVKFVLKKKEKKRKCVSCLLACFYLLVNKREDNRCRLWLQVRLEMTVKRNFNTDTVCSFIYSLNLIQLTIN